MAIDPTTDPFVLEGRIVTMGPRGVIPDGRIFIQGGEIIAVRAAGEPTPAGFVGAARVRTGDTIYPGLIELHNHLSYNAMPLWDVPTRYTNNDQWRGPAVDDYRRLITKPSQVLGQTDGVMQALVRFVECRALLGGVTTSQGITLANAGGLTRFYRGLVRNAEDALEPGLRGAGTNIANPEKNGAEAYLAKLGPHTCYLQHLSEGCDDTARSWFLRLRRANGDWAITDALCGIHAAALRREDFDVLAARGASMVWSPMSNFLLYGDTADIRAANDAGMRIALGSDWAPSGTKNLLGELKVAWLTSEERGGVFSAEELVRMVTSNPAEILKWDARLGTIQEGRLADLVVVNGQTDDAFRQLIEARETSITMVMIGGVPRVGQTTLMHRFGPGSEEIRIGGARRVLELTDAATDPLVAGRTLTDCIAVLDDAMVRLPQLAVDIDTATAFGAFSGAADGTGDTVRVVPDFETEDRVIEAAFLAATGINLAAEPYAFWVRSMRLDPITVADDRAHLRGLVRARNLPDFVKRGLPGLYGVSIPIPAEAEFLADPPTPVAPQVVDTTRPLDEFLRTFGELSLGERRTIVDQALLLLQENYVHLPLKRAMHAVDPAQRLRLLRHRLDGQTDATMPPEATFHAEVTDIFNALRDLHTGYRLPAPFSSRVAWLPFLVEECVRDGRRVFLVTKVVADAGPADFLPGVEVTHWNGMTMEAAVARNGERQAGSNQDARHARGLNSLTIRPLARSLPPDEEWVTVRYVPLSGPDAGRERTAEFTQRWLVFEPGDAGRMRPDDLLASATAIGLDDHTDDIQHVRKVLFAPEVAMAETAARGQLLPAAIANTPDGLETRLPGVFRARIVRASDAGPGDPSYGYIRIFTFSVSDAEPFVDEFVRLVEALPVDGLIVDVRGNGGGLIFAAEELLQVLAPRRIEPERAQFITTPLTLRICSNHERSTRLPGLELGAWVPSIRDAVQTGATYSKGFPISSEAACNDRGQRYFGPSVLITDPLCYSATDMFAAGFQDHVIGPVIGVWGATGAGGANVWPHGLLEQLMVPDNIDPGPSPYRPLPRGADLRVAARRTTRVGANAGDVLEDLGVTPDIRHEMTEGDVLDGNRDLIDLAIGRLAQEKAYPVRIDVRPRAGQSPLVVVHAPNLTRMDASIGERWLASRPVRRGRAELDPEEALDGPGAGAADLEIIGYDGEDVAVRLRRSIELS